MAITHAGPIAVDALEGYLADASKPLRPVITNLNDDNAWLLSCPRPPAERQTTGRYFYHVVLDPWLTNDGAGMGGTWVFNMMRKTEAKVSSADAVGALASQIEAIASKQRPMKVSGSQTVPGGVDAIFISNEQSDHCHEATLRGFSHSVPVFAVPLAVQKISKWRHFTTLVELQPFNSAGEKWQEAHVGDALPQWLTVANLVGHTMAHFALAIIISSEPSAKTSEVHELIIFAPHGLLPTHPQLEALIERGSPPVKTLAIMHPLKESWTLGVKIYLGVRNALAMAQKSHAPYYVKTADSVLNMTGILSYAVSEKAGSFQTGLEEEKQAGQNGGHYQPSFFEVENGKCLILE